MESVLFQTSLVAAFVAGMVVLFFSCCIFFLFSAYLRSVFKEKEKIVLMTLVFGAGIFVTLMPAVLGVALISKMLFRYHDAIYITGGLLMLFVAAVTFLGLKLPMPSLPNAKIGRRSDILSIFTLGIFSGITSACCAPVLIGIMTLTFLSPSFFGALLVGGTYVLGMVVPLLIMAVFFSAKMPKKGFFRRPVTSINLFGRTYMVALSNLIASVIFFATGILALGLTLTGKLSSQDMGIFTKTITGVLSNVNNVFGSNIFVNILFLVVLAFLIYKVSKKL